MKRYKYITLNEKDVYAIGDIHGGLIRMLNDFKGIGLRDATVIVCGDIGLGFENESKTFAILHKLNDGLKELNIHTIMIRGNHDDKTWFEDSKVDLEYVKCVSDYTVLNIGDKNILCVGGAISIDRKYRISRYQSTIENCMRYGYTYEDAKRVIIRGYWENEIPIYNEEALDEIKNDGLSIDYITSHTSPSFAFKSDTRGIEGFLSKDELLLTDLTDEREVFNKIYNKVMNDEHPLKEWIYGHFHEHNSEIINNVLFITLLNSDYKLDLHKIITI